MSDLKQLPPEHLLRNKLLKEIGAECRNIHAKPSVWKAVGEWKIGRVTFNQLSATWIENFEWRAYGTLNPTH